MPRRERWFCETEKCYGSVESFIFERMRGGAEPLLFGYLPFHYLWEKSLLRENDVIRTNLQGGHIDGHYKINANGNLEGIEVANGLYSGKEGVYTPKEVLNVKHADHGWTLCFFSRSRIYAKVLEGKL